MTNSNAQALVSQKIIEIKACIKTNRTAFSQNAGTIEIMLDGLAVDAATVPNLRLIK